MNTHKYEPMKNAAGTIFGKLFKQAKVNFFLFLTFLES